MWTIISVLILVGLLMMILEILVIPGSGFAGVIGFVLMAAGVWLAYTRVGVMAGNITLISTITINVVGLILALRSKTWKKASLDAVNDGKVNKIDAQNLLVGMKGTTISRCTPMGKAVFNDKYYEVSTLSEFIDEGIEVEIIRVSGNKIYIKKINS
jgi:membrane-bound ClpP family serine protease